MICVQGLTHRVPGCLNIANHYKCRHVQGVPGVPGSRARVRVRNTHAPSKIKSHHVHALSTLYTLYTQYKVVNTMDSDVQATRYTKNKPGTQKISKPLRQKMPQTAAWIDSLRAGFGAPMIDAAIKAGIEGQQTFYARENGLEIGTASPADIPGKVVSLRDMCIWSSNTLTPKTKDAGRGWKK